VRGFLLDTNILSDAIKPIPSPLLLAWMEAQEDDQLFISSVSVAEILRGILDKPAGRKRSALEAWFAGPSGPRSLFAGRILSFDETAALVWARLMSDGRARGKPRSEVDMLVAAIAEANDCVIVTDNTRDFSGLGTIDPMRSEI
jgi:predicted nucleic acid-binding protein